MEKVDDYDKLIEQIIQRARIENLSEQEIRQLYFEEVDKYHKRKGSFRAEAIYVIILNFWVLIFGVYGYGAITSPKSPFVADLIKLTISPTGRFFFISSIVAFGLLLYTVKKKQQFWYGVAETTFALVNCYTFSSDIQNHIVHQDFSLYVLISGFATLYLLVRGFTNVDEGRRKEYFLKRQLLAANVFIKDFLSVILDDI